jgi:hypothetical protein
MTGASSSVLASPTVMEMVSSSAPSLSVATNVTL